jgi:hypothetical protein
VFSKQGLPYWIPRCLLRGSSFKIKDHRRKQGQRYGLGHILLFSVFAILSGAKSYREIHAFIKERYRNTLKDKFKLSWKRLPAYTTIRNIIQGVSSESLEECFREYGSELAGSAGGKRFMSFDGKVLRGSFDNFQDRKAIQILSVFLSDDDIILAHEEIPDKTNEIPTAQELIVNLGMENCVFTFDALHCQKKL